MMSSRRAASRALWELFEIIDKYLAGREVVFKSYSKMHLPSISRRAYGRRLEKFEKQGLVKRKETEQGQVFIITNRAKLLRRTAITKSWRSDGNATLIIFDIPEEKHNARDTLRRYLVRNGYTQIQKSSFLSPFKISEDLKDLTRELGLQSNLIFFSAKIDRAFY